MKSLLAVLVLATVVCSATPAAAYIAHVSTSVAVADANDELAVKQALQIAVDDLLSDGIGFTPTLVVLTRAILLDGRLYIRLLVADDEGARLFRDGGADDFVAASGI
jgi:hypothetical protein